MLKIIKMFNAQTYSSRRNKLKSILKTGILVFPGNNLSPRNYRANVLKFRQDSNFLYFFGINRPSLTAVIDIDNNKEILYGDNLTMEDIIWMGNLESLESLGKKSDIHNVKPFSKLASDILPEVSKRKIHYLPPYTLERQNLISEITNIEPTAIQKNVSVEMIKAVSSLRSVKEPCEVEEIENTITSVTRNMHITAMKMAQPERYEYEIAGEIEGIIAKHNSQPAYPVICSVHGEVLHNEDYSNKLKAGDMLLVDAGCESQEFYATDITRTFSAGGKFTPIQKDIYSIVLDVQEYAISLIKPGIKYQDIHLAASKRMVSGLQYLNFFKGDPEEIVHSGAHAILFPHGLGHMIGLDVHDMEDLGEDFVGYDEKTQRSSLFGTGYLRLGKELKPGYVLTVEPGIYFIPPLIHQWETKKMFENFINYSEIKKNLSFGGIRIEDNILVTRENNRVLGEPIPKKIVDISW